IIREARKHFPDRRYMVADATKVDMPRVDLVLLKEVTQHLSDNDFYSLLGHIQGPCTILHSGVFPLVRASEDIETGGFRPYRLCWDESPLLVWRAGDTTSFVEAITRA